MKYLHKDTKLPLRLARQHRGLSAKEVARRMKSSISSVCAWETGARNPKPKHVKGLCKALRIPRRNLLI